MKRVVVVFPLLLLLVTALPGGAAEPPQQLRYIKGWVVDMVGGKENANTESAPVVIELHTVKKAPLAFYDVEQDQLYQIEDQKTALGYVGREIHVFGVVDVDTGRIKIGSYVDGDSTRKKFDRGNFKRMELPQDDS